MRGWNAREREREKRRAWLGGRKRKHLLERRAMLAGPGGCL